jgi:thioredoxin 1
MKKLIYAVLPVIFLGIFGFVLNSSNSGFNITVNDIQANTLKSNDELNPVTLTEQNFESEVIESDIPVVVEFYAKWCGACKKLTPIINELSNENKDMLKFGMVDIDENPNLASKYEINSIPRLLIFHKGKIVKDIEGYHSKDELQEILTEVCNKCQDM